MQTKHTAFPQQKDFNGILFDLSNSKKQIGHSGNCITYFLLCLSAPLIQAIINNKLKKGKNCSLTKFFCSRRSLDEIKKNKFEFLIQYTKHVLKQNFLKTVNI
jgi:hypothetical protein